MVAQTSISPRTVTGTLSKGTAYNQTATAYNSHLTYNQPTSTNGTTSARTVVGASVTPRTTSSASMKVR